METPAHAQWVTNPFPTAGTVGPNMLGSNTDDHLRSHGFILVPGKGWRLSDAYDMNPVSESHGLKLNVSEADNAMDLELARSVAP